MAQGFVRESDGKIDGDKTLCAGRQEADPLHDLLFVSHGRVHITPQRDLRIGMSKQFRDSLDVRALLHAARGIGVARTVEVPIRNPAALQQGLEMPLAGARRQWPCWVSAE